MKKKIFYLIALIFFIANTLHANPVVQKNPDTKTQRQQKIDRILDERLHLTEDQKVKLEENRKQYREEMAKTIQQMEFLRRRIKHIYLTETNKLEANFKATPLKIELALLKQEANRIRLQSRKNFENTLNESQRTEFQKIKDELHNKKSSIKN